MATINLSISFSHPEAISSTIRYARIDNTNNPVYTTQTGVTVSPLIIQNVPNGQYIVGITPVYADGRVCTEVFQQTEGCAGIISFSAVLTGGNIVVSYNATSNVPFVQVNISYPNGGSFSQQYTNNGVDITITSPAGVYGDYSVNIQPVCDQDTGFLGTPSAPAIVTITAPNNSTLTNNTAGPLAPISLTAYSTGSQLIFTSPSVAGSGGVINFLLSDASYTALVINYGTGTVAAASLTTGTGTYTGVLTSGVITFNNVIASGGVVITIT